VPPIFGSQFLCLHLHDAPGHTSSTSRQHCNATLLDRSTQWHHVDLRSFQRAKRIEMAQCIAMLHNSLHLLPLIGFSGPFQGHFRAIPGPFQGHSRAISGPFQGHLNEKIMIQHQWLYIWPRLSSPQHHRDPKTSQPHAKLWAPAITKVGWDSIIKIGHTMT
jgi:hypothetical protein